MDHQLHPQSATQRRHAPRLGLPPGGLGGHLSRDCTAETKPKSCYKCGEEGHISHECPNAPAATAAPSPAGTTRSGRGRGGARTSTKSTGCYKCGKEAQMARACPDAGTSTTAPPSGPSAAAAGKTCYSCGGTGHLSRDCELGAKCYNCAGGHLSRDCPEPQKRACYTCRGEGCV
ncbi:hypothetical protein DFH09DRAFT_1257590 [Mycena vulgaris]|nr:hypothetical protein DFH09DRAFT_1257590 [Mycena vulgaris]